MSSVEGKDWVRERVAALAGERPLSVLDVGPGVGTYAKLLADLPISRIVGIEAWEPYVHTYRLRDFYDEIIVADVRDADLPPVDVVVLGDVLEHMTRDEAVRLWQRCGAAAARAVYLSIPIVHYPQGEIEDNPYEIHVEEDWKHDDVLSLLPGVGAFWTGIEVGVYERRTG